MARASQTILVALPKTPAYFYCQNQARSIGPFRGKFCLLYLAVGVLEIV